MGDYLLMNDTKILRLSKHKLWFIFVILILLTVLYFIVCWLTLFFVIKPIPKLPVSTPRELGFDNAEPLSFESKEDRVPLKGWFFSASGDRVIIMVHGIHSHCWDGQQPDLVRAFLDAGFSVLIFDLRGHGLSGGNRLGLGWSERKDVYAAADLLLSRGFKPGKIGIHGTSYGAAISLLSMPNIREVGALVADSAFADVLDVVSREINRRTGIPLSLVKVMIPGIKLMGRIFYSIDFNADSPEKEIANIISRPVLLIHGSEDTTTPVSHAYRLHNAAKKKNDNIDMWILEGREHTEGIRLAPDYRNLSPLREKYIKRIIEFFSNSL